jgi:hypothetical protein
MLFNISQKNPRQDREIDALVGSSFSFVKRIRMGGIGSPRLLINESSPQISSRIESTEDRKMCNVELRPQGIILRFNSKLTTYAWVIPYRLLSIYQNGSQWSIHAAGNFVKVFPEGSPDLKRQFMQKLIREKTSSLVSHFQLT